MPETFDVLVLGGGVAGLSAAIRSARAGARVAVITKAALGASATQYAQGGVAAVLPHTTWNDGEVPDSPELHLADTLTDIRGDVRDRAQLQVVIEKYQPQLIFHLAAQPIVLLGYQHPVETFETNVNGTIICARKSTLVRWIEAAEASGSDAGHA